MSTVTQQTFAAATELAHAEPKVRKRRPSRQIGVHIGLLVLVFLSLAPYLFMLVTSLKDNQQYNENFWALAFPLHWENFGTAWTQIQPYLVASVIVAVGSVIGIIAVSLLAGFVLARFRFPGRTFLFTLIAALMMVPSISSLIPLFLMMRDLGLLNTFAVLIIPQVATGAILGTILMKTFIEGIPQTLFEAAAIDGAGPVRLFRSIMLPLSLPVIGTVSLVTIQGVWNDFFWPLLTVTDNNLKTVSVGLLFFQGQSSTAYGPMFAGYLLASIPLLVLFIFFSRYFLAGIQGGLPGSH
ncbi:carbohydrate ABC transporter permease [Leifsonia naganoensis]|uniref:ABC-type glycerol-3-phosphate transport system permease component n=1 Tax=Leifsonia naganoensis TaxID=150025 RepID=A0A853DRR4_9MICO|nr:carbohydrate ABC transporter permease [Leifsonia naganoensis]NYK09284.1 ABC-type glycerol-3-phosphate transport system permease component [Leifsonia naganoensis]